MVISTRGRDLLSHTTMAESEGGKNYHDVLKFFRKYNVYTYIIYIYISVFDGMASNKFPDVYTAGRLLRIQDRAEV